MIRMKERRDSLSLSVFKKEEREEGSSYNLLSFRSTETEIKKEREGKRKKEKEIEGEINIAFHSLFPAFH